MPLPYLGTIIKATTVTLPLLPSPTAPLGAGGTHLASNRHCTNPLPSALLLLNLFLSSPSVSKEGICLREAAHIQGTSTSVLDCPWPAGESHILRISFLSHDNHILIFTCLPVSGCAYVGHLWNSQQKCDRMPTVSTRYTCIIQGMCIFLCVW